MADIQPPSPDWLHQIAAMKAPHIIAGAFGGLVRGLVSSGFSWSQRLSSAVIGAGTAGYGTPAASPFVRQWLDAWGYPPVDIEGSVGFVLGLIGMTACDVGIRAAKQWLPRLMRAGGRGA